MTKTRPDEHKGQHEKGLHLWQMLLSLCATRGKRKAVVILTSEVQFYLSNLFDALPVFVWGKGELVLEQTWLYSAMKKKKTLVYLFTRCFMQQNNP